MTRAEYESKKQVLLAEIERAFAGVERDEEIVAWVKNLTPSATSDKEQLLGAGARWQDVSDEWIQENHYFLIYLDAHSFRFYLPAYLSWFLRFMDYEGDDEEDYFSSSTFGSVLHVLTIYERQAEELRKKYSLLNPEQERAVAHFVVFQCERFAFLYEQEESEAPAFRGYKGSRGYKNAYEPCQGALRDYWGQFLEGGFVQADFPFSGSSRKWRNMIARRKVIEPQRLEAYEARKRALIAEIERAFDGVEREDGRTLHEASAMDDYASPEELAQARLLDPEARWQDVPDEDIQYGHMSLIYLDDKGFHYYLPAYLVWYLRFIDNEEEHFYSETFGSVGYALGIRFKLDIDDEELLEPIRQLESLLGTSFDEQQDSIFNKFSAFSDEQKRAIAHFLHFKHEQLDYSKERRNYIPDPEDEEDEKADLARAHANIQRPLDKYWGQFL